MDVERLDERDKRPNSLNCKHLCPRKRNKLIIGGERIGMDERDNLHFRTITMEGLVSHESFVNKSYRPQ